MHMSRTESLNYFRSTVYQLSSVISYYDHAHALALCLSANKYPRLLTPPCILFSLTLSFLLVLFSRYWSVTIMKSRTCVLTSSEAEIKEAEERYEAARAEVQELS